ncbi:MAG TPA: gliding motility-associated C-terminal domain-containing protein [Bacteroidia bacterium]
MTPFLRNTVGLIFMCSAFLLSAQNISFRKNYEIWNESSMHNFQRTSDGGFILSTDAVYEMDPVGNASRGYLIKTDYAGNTQWIKCYVKSGSQVKPDDGCSVFQCTDNGYIVSSSYYTSAGQVLRLIRTDASGNLLWSKMYPGLGISSAYCVSQTSDGGYIAGGWTMDLFTGSTRGYILKTDASGNPQFGKVLSDPNGNTNWVYAVRQRSSGEYIFCGSSNFSPWVGKLDQQGGVLWEKQFSMVNSGGDFYDLCESSSGNIVLTGDAYPSGGYGMSLIEVTQAGNVNWQKFYDGAIGYSLKQDAGNWMVSLVIIDNQSFADRDAIASFNTSGNLNWCRKINSTSYNLANTIELIPGGAFALESSAFPHVSILRTDNSGHFGCGDIDIVLSTVPVTLALVSGLTVTDSIPVIPDNLVFSIPAVNENDSCVYRDSTSNTVPCEDSVFIPNVFTPNSDGQNDVFNDIGISCDPGYHMRIYDRWGEMVFESTANTKHWDGKTFSGADAPDGTYYYVLVVGKRTFKGFLTLLR